MGFGNEPVVSLRAWQLNQSEAVEIWPHSVEGSAASHGEWENIRPMQSDDSSGGFRQCPHGCMQTWIPVQTEEASAGGSSRSSATWFTSFANN
jgi:hypothetical protein